MKLALLVSMLVSLVGFAEERQWKVGEYSVPVPGHLAKVATFPTMYTTEKDTDGKLILRYKLPQDLAPASAPEIVLKEAGKHGSLFHFAGEQGDGSCRKRNDELTCFIVYPGYHIALDEVNAGLEARYHDQPDLALRKEVAFLFSNDPKGIVRYRGLSGR